MKIVHLFSYVGLPLSLFFTSLLYAQQTQSRTNQAIATLEEYAAKLPQAIAKTIRCARGVDTCTQAEITQARTIIGVVGAAFAVVALGIAAGVTTKVKGWWPFDRTTPEPIVTPTIPIITQENAINAASILAQIYAGPVFLQKQPQTQNIIQQNISIIDAAIDQGLLTPQMLSNTVPEQTYTLEQVIQHFIGLGATSKYVR